MTGFVLDASIALAWCFSDEATPTTKKLLEQLEVEVAHVPSIWPLEIGNILIMAVRRKRINYANVSEFISLLQNINIQIDEQTPARGFREILSLAYSEELTTYDAAYLELAMRLGKPLATKDQELRHAANRLGVALIK